MDWQSLLAKIKAEVGSGEITTYRELSQWGYDHPHGTQAVVAMLKAAVNANQSNVIYTNRVVPESGKIAGVNGQEHQLISEGIVLISGAIDMTKATVVRFGNTLL